MVHRRAKRSANYSHQSEADRWLLLGHQAWGRDSWREDVGRSCDWQNTRRLSGRPTRVLVESFYAVQSGRVFDKKLTRSLQYLGAGSELVFLVLEQDVERGERSVTARNVLLQVELVRIAQFIARIHFLFENSQIIPNHDDFVEECFERHFFRLK